MEIFKGECGNSLNNIYFAFFEFLGLTVPLEKKLFAMVDCRESISDHSIREIHIEMKTISSCKTKYHHVYGVNC